MGFRPCIDLRNGRVVQIVGGSLRDGDIEGPVTNFQTERSSEEYALMYREDGLFGGHVISLGPGNHEAAVSALGAFPGGLQIGGGITPDNAPEYLDAGASHVIVTSYAFSNGRIDMDRIRELVRKVGKNRLVLDLSCRKMGSEFRVVTNRWQSYTEVPVGREILLELGEYCDEFLVHGVDVEGRMEGIQTELVEILGQFSPVPVTYAGGAKTLSDLDLVKRIGRGLVDLTIGSALDIFGGTIPYCDVVQWHNRNRGT